MASSLYEKAKKRCDEIEAVIQPPKNDWGRTYDQLFEIEQMTGPNQDGSPVTLDQFVELDDGTGNKFGTKAEWIKRKELEFAKKNEPEKFR